MGLALFGTAGVLVLLWQLSPATLIWLAIANLLTFWVYAYDKAQAASHRWRVPEAALHLLNLATPAGAGLGRWLVQHKTLKPAFGLTVGVGGALAWLLAALIRN